MSEFRVLVVDNDPVFARLVREVLTNDGCRVTTAELGGTAIDLFAKHSADLILLDLALPDMEGQDVCRALRALRGGEAATVVCLTGKQELADRVAGFHAGADDYLTKPIDIYELWLRVQAIRRRQLGYQPAAEGVTAALIVGPLSLLPQSRTLRTPAGEVQLTPIEYQLLLYLMIRPGTLCSTETLLQDVWHYHPGTGSPDLVRFHVRALRKKIEPDPSSPSYLVSVPHHGYMIAAGSEAARKGVG
jgi:DNA-binding response OmpR family regulator